MDAVEFLKERERMCSYYMGKGRCQINNCPFYALKCKIQGEGSTIAFCSSVLYNLPEEAVEAVEKWSNEHPVYTLLDQFKRQHPEAPKNSYGMPVVCPHQIGYEPKANAPCFRNKQYDCLSCWKRPAKGAETE